MSEEPSGKEVSSEKEFSKVSNEEFNEAVSIEEESSEKLYSAAIRANHPIPLQCGLFYFEVDIIDKGKNGLVVYIFFKYCS